MRKPTVSVILPNRNYADFVSDAINSVKAQTLSDWECIIVDDASNDNSVDIIRNLISDDKRFKLIVNDAPIGISATRNIGLDMANGEYIAFLDSDDCYMDFFLEMLVGVARKKNAPVVGARAKYIDGHYTFKKSDVKWDADDYVVFDNPIDMEGAPQYSKWVWIWRRIYRRDVIQNIRFRDEMKVNGDDVTFMLDLVWRVPNVIELNVNAVCHRIHPYSVTSEHQDFNLERVEMFPLLFKYIRENLLDKYKDDFLRVLYRSLFRYMLSECLIKHSIKLTEQDKQELRRVLATACGAIVKKYLPLKYRLLCGYLAWIK